MRASKGVSDPRAPSVDSAPVAKAEPNSVSALNRPTSALAVENCVPLSSASPSLGRGVIGSRPTSASAAAAGVTRSPTRASPTPIIAAAIWASGARSPDAPTDPCDGTTGVTPRASMASMRASVCGWTPEAPCARLPSFSAIMSRVVATEAVSPTPAACDSTMLR